MSRLFLLIILSTFRLISFAEDKKYPVSDIPENMKQGMYAVIREKETRFEIKEKGKSVYYEHYAITILNERGKQYATETVGYDKLSKVSTFKGIVYDASGSVIRKLKQSEIYDQSSISGFSLYEDDRLKYADLSQSSYPYTVEFEYELQMNFLYSIPSFYFYTDDEVSTQKVSYTLVYPIPLLPRIKSTRIAEPAKSHSNNIETVSWTFENIVPSKFEPYGPDLKRSVPNIQVGPTLFEYGGFEGSMSSWSEYGKWEASLLKNRGELPEVTKMKVKEMTKGLTSKEEKARVLYEFLQSKTRYVSIQEGIGGNQPFQAEVVDRMGYGDCKALSNYMVSLLKAADVEAFYSPVRAGDGEPDILVDFPNHQSNHVIVAVPNGKDTLWLECTSQTNPFGYLGTFTGDRKAFVITNEGGYIVNTQKYPTEINTQIQKADVTVLMNGDAKANIKTIYSAIQYENNDLNYNVIKAKEDQKKWIQENTKINGFEITSFSMENRKTKIPSATVTMQLGIARYANVSGKRLFMTPNLMNRSTTMPKKIESRKENVVRKSGYVDVDTITYQLPEELYPEFLPQPVKIESRFGQYSADFKLEQGKLVYIRRVKMVKGEFPPESYNELVDFYKNINKADNTKIVFLNKT